MFREGDDFSVIMKAIDSVDTRGVVSRRGLQLQHENEPFYVDMEQNRSGCPL